MDSAVSFFLFLFHHYSRVIFDFARLYKSASTTISNSTLPNKNGETLSEQNVRVNGNKRSCIADVATAAVVSR